MVIIISCIVSELKRNIKKWLYIIFNEEQYIKKVLEL